MSLRDSCLIYCRKNGIPFEKSENKCNTNKTIEKIKKASLLCPKKFGTKDLMEKLNKLYPKNKIDRRKIARNVSYCVTMGYFDIVKPRKLNGQCVTYSKTNLFKLPNKTCLHCNKHIK